MIRTASIIAASLTLTACATPYGILENRIVCTLDGTSLMMVSRYGALGISSNAVQEDARIVCPQRFAAPIPAPIPAPQPIAQPQPQPIAQPQPAPRPPVTAPAPAPAASEPLPEFPPRPIVTPSGVIYPPLIIQPKKVP